MHDDWYWYYCYSYYYDDCEFDDDDVGAGVDDDDYFVDANEVADGEKIVDFVDRLSLLKNDLGLWLSCWFYLDNLKNLI